MVFINTLLGRSGCLSLCVDPIIINLRHHLRLGHRVCLWHSLPWHLVFSLVMSSSVLLTHVSSASLLRLVVCVFSGYKCLS